MRTNIATMTLTLACIVTIATVAPAQERAGSVLSRLQTVEDPELGELIRVAIENYGRVYNLSADSDKELEITREVTEAYARITLLDRQIEQTEFRYRNSTSPVRDEMMLAMAELESKRTMELANLREVMRITPAIAFGRRPESQLRGWYILDIIDANTFFVHTRRRLGGRKIPPFAGRMTSSMVFDQVSDWLDDASSLPIRVDITRSPDTADLAETMESRIIDMIRQANLQMQAEVHLESVYNRSSRLRFIVLRDQIGTNVRSGEGLPELRGTIDPNGVIERVDQLVSLSLRLPATVDLIVYEGSEPLGDRLVAMIDQEIRRLGIADLVDIHRTVRPQDPRWQYVGQWESTDGNGILLRLDSDLDVEQEQIIAGQRVMRHGKWSLQDGAVVLVSLNQPLQGRCIATIDASGNLEVDTGSRIISFVRAEE